MRELGRVVLKKLLIPVYLRWSNCGGREHVRGPTGAVGKGVNGNVIFFVADAPAYVIEATGE